MIHGATNNAESEILEQSILMVAVVSEIMYPALPPPQKKKRSLFSDALFLNTRFFGFFSKDSEKETRVQNFFKNHGILKTQPSNRASFSEGRRACNRMLPGTNIAVPFVLHFGRLALLQHIL